MISAKSSGVHAQKHRKSRITSRNRIIPRLSQSSMQPLRKTALAIFIMLSLPIYDSITNSFIAITPIRTTFFQKTADTPVPSADSRKTRCRHPYNQMSAVIHMRGIRKIGNFGGFHYWVMIREVRVLNAARAWA